MIALKDAGRRIEVSDQDRSELERIVRAMSSKVRIVERARIVLAAAEGMTGKEVAAEVGCSLPTVLKWRGRYAELGMEGLRDAPRPGAPLTHGPETRALLIAKACTRPKPTEKGARRERWTYEELGQEVGMSGSQAHVILKRAAIKPNLTQLLGDERLLQRRVRGADGRDLRAVRRTARQRAGRLDRREDRRSRPNHRPSPTGRRSPASPPAANTSTSATAPSAGSPA